jgi:hypothetical protein
MPKNLLEIFTESLQQADYQMKNRHVNKISRKKGDLLTRWYYFC